MKYLKKYKTFESSDDKELELMEIGRNLNDILYDITDDGNIHLYPSMYNNKLHGVGGVMIEMSINSEGELSDEFFLITDDIIKTLQRCISYVNDENRVIVISGIANSDTGSFNEFSIFRDRDNNTQKDFGKILNKKVHTISIIIK